MAEDGQLARRRDLQMALTLSAIGGGAGDVGAHRQIQRIDVAYVVRRLKIAYPPSAGCSGPGVFRPDDVEPDGETSLEKFKVTPELGINIDIGVAVDHAVDGHVGPGVNFQGVVVENGELKDRDLSQENLLADGGGES